MREIEGVEDHARGFAVGDRILQRAEAADAALVEDDDLAVDYGVFAGQRVERLRHVAVTLGPVEAAAREKPGLAVVDDGNGAIAVELDLVQPFLALRRLVDRGRELRLEGFRQRRFS